MAFPALEREMLWIWSQLRKAALGLRIGKRWKRSEGAEGELTRRLYPDYTTYLDHQGLKHDALRARSLEGHDRRFSAALTDRLRECPVPFAGRSVLCLAARTGAEVRVFAELGAFAIGIDLNPGRRNRWVVEGDFHELQFASGSVDVVYVNSLDHVFDLERVVAEVRRVLKPDGVLIAEIGLGLEEGNSPGFYEALAWRSTDDLTRRIAATGFEQGRRISFDVPWKGVQVLLKKLS